MKTPTTKGVGVRDAGIEDVARLAKVSIASVSRVLNGSTPVSAAIRSRVDSAIRQLNYVRHGAARALSSRRSLVIGAIVPTVDNAIFARGIAAFQQRLSEAGYSLILACSYYDPEKELRAAKILVERGVDAVMLVGTSHREALLDLLAARAIPYVITWALDAKGNAPCVGFDNRLAMRRMVAYLADLGHRRFAMLAGITRNNDRSKARVDGLREELRSRGLAIGRDEIIECAYDIAQARMRTREILSHRPCPGVIVCGNDVLAFGALFECRAQGLGVPCDLSITGFDDLELSLHIEPELTTMHVPCDAMGSLAADHLLVALGGSGMPRSVALEALLVIRGSTGPPQNNSTEARRRRQGA